MKSYKKKDFPVEEARRFLEPSPVVLVSSAWKGKTNIMAMGWYTIMEFTPSLIGCVISNQNASFDMVKNSKECVINVPTKALAKKVVGIGNCSGKKINKFEKFKLTPMPASKVDAPLILECFASFECKIVDTKLIKQYNFFVFEILKAHVATSPKYPQTIHYRGNGVFMLSGKSIKLPSKV